ncbi:hypothetical protein EV182_008220, partial [Spiromyces aspiralis]
MLSLASDFSKRSGPAKHSGGFYTRTASSNLLDVSRTSVTIASAQTQGGHVAKRESYNSSSTGTSNLYRLAETAEGLLHQQVAGVGGDGDGKGRALGSSHSEVTGAATRSSLSNALLASRVVRLVIYDAALNVLFNQLVSTNCNIDQVFRTSYSEAPFNV